jgi:hypothetical protein
MEDASEMLLIKVPIHYTHNNSTNNCLCFLAWLFYIMLNILMCKKQLIKFYTVLFDTCSLAMVPFGFKHISMYCNMKFITKCSAFCMISSFCSEVVENCHILGRYAASGGNFLLKFQDNYWSHLEGSRNEDGTDKFSWNFSKYLLQLEHNNTKQHSPHYVFCCICFVNCLFWLSDCF